MWFRAGDGHPSLRRRLAGLVLAAIALASLVQGVIAYRGALGAADAIFDRYLENLAQAVVQQGQAPGSVDLFEYSIRTWGPNGPEVLQGHAARIPEQPVIGFSDTEVEGVRYRVYRLRTADRTIQVAQDLDARDSRARAMALDAVLPTALLAPLLMLAVWLLMNHSIAPLERVRRQVSRRAPEDLSPLPETGLPQEVLPLVRELNQLFGRARENLHAQQRFVADAAHELRSPLTALKLQAQGLRRSGGNDEAAVTRLNEGIDRLIALASQLLALARAESGGAPRREAVDLEQVCREVMGDVLPQAQARDIDVGLSQREAAVIQGDPDTLPMLVRNLLDNAVKYAPQGGRVDISIQRSATGVSLCVEDNGPGIPEDQRAQALERFARLPGSGTAQGSGLGLAIVAAVSRSHGARLALDHGTRLGGLLACVTFPQISAEA
ncbi:ATP-binding protein [Ramlibacter humi]|uniref:histidine kinase n=1 Tax=Ramlibacter humi TaxID=2530451 RepID=A0A4Z0BD14_9BURK|nr:ATP-binding protein [Ramlibacter humi]TFY97186.1 two-component sensor histidine kinase [Ramlibacter humi]